LGLAQLAVDLDPLDFSGLTNLAMAHWALGQLEEEERTYWRILELYPDAHSINSFLAAALAQQGRPEEGLQYIDFRLSSGWILPLSVEVSI
jgi:tetratricopeptide (TPR) repeat protein